MSHAHKYVVEPSRLAWKPFALGDARETQLQMYITGSDGGPEAIRAPIPEGYTVEPHFHYAAQFQVLLDGSMTFPLVRLHAPAIHYTEHSTPYGPFVVRDGHDMLVLHSKPGGLTMMQDKKDRWKANVQGREFACNASDVKWEPMPGYKGARRKRLIPASFGPTADLVEFPSRAEWLPPANQFGRYEVGQLGAAVVAGRELGPKSLRFVEPGKPGTALRMGDHGATMIFLNFDEDGSFSGAGNTEEAIAHLEHNERGRGENE